MDSPSPLKRFVLDYSPYVEDLRRRLVLVAIMLAATFFVGFFLAPHLIKDLVGLLGFKGVEYAIFSPFQLVSTSMDVGFAFAIISTSPLIVAEIYEFGAAAFTRKERAQFRNYLAAGYVLFAIGFVYGLFALYYAVWGISSFNSALGVMNVWNVDSFISQALITSTILGIFFEFPLVLLFLTRFGILKRSLLVAGRRYAIGASVIIVGLLPTTNILSLIIMALPLIGMYELTLLLAREKKRQAVPTFLSVRPLLK